MKPKEGVRTWKERTCRSNEDVRLSLFRHFRDVLLNRCCRSEWRLIRIHNRPRNARAPAHTHHLKVPSPIHPLILSFFWLLIPECNRKPFHASRFRNLNQSMTLSLSLYLSLSLARAREGLPSFSIFVSRFSIRQLKHASLTTRRSFVESCQDTRTREIERQTEIEGFPGSLGLFRGVCRSNIPTACIQFKRFHYSDAYYPDVSLVEHSVIRTHFLVRHCGLCKLWVETLRVHLFIGRMRRSESAGINARTCSKYVFLRE